jgi:hypothetical protein
MKYIKGFIRWLFKPSNDHATLKSCIQRFKKEAQ